MSEKKFTTYIWKQELEKSEKTKIMGILRVLRWCQYGEKKCTCIMCVCPKMFFSKLVKIVFENSKPK